MSRNLSLTFNCSRATVQVIVRNIEKHGYVPDGLITTCKTKQKSKQIANDLRGTTVPTFNRDDLLLSIYRDKIHAGRLVIYCEKIQLDEPGIQKSLVYKRKRQQYQLLTSFRLYQYL